MRQFSLIASFNKKRKNAVKIILKRIKINIVDFLYFGTVLSLIIYPFHGFDLYLFLPILLGLIVSLILKYLNRLVKNQLVENLISIGIMSIAFGCLLKFVYNLDKIFIISMLFFILLIIRQIEIKR